MRRKRDQYVEADYGTDTPQDFDRFGVNQTYRIWDTRTLQYITPQFLGDAVQRLGLILRKWSYVHYSGYSTYNLDIHGRPMQIVHYADGRLLVELDNRVIYRQVKRHRKTGTVVEEEISREVEAAQREEEKEARLDAVREMLRERHGR